MTVLKQILDWSKDRPLWQRDALRRLVLNGALSDDDIRHLTEVCKSAHGLAEPQEAALHTKADIPDNSDGGEPISLESIFHHQGVNALANDQTLKFGPSLTVVYGDNAAGKTGYIRILKSACRARGQEEVLGNVVSGATPPTPVVSIKYKVGDEAEPREWTGNGEDEFVSRVNIFDSQSAAVYLTEKTDVAFRPFGLDLFDKLVRACKSVRNQLEQEQPAPSSNALASVKAQVPEGTDAAGLLVNITSLTKPEAVKNLTRLSSEEEARLALSEKSLLDLQAKDPEKLIQQLMLRAGRAKALAQHVKNVEAALSKEAFDAVFSARTESRRKSEEAKRCREATFPSEMLSGTGSESWTHLWEVARSFSMELAYLNQSFPVVEDGARCVFCQQNLDHAARHRLQQFEEFVASKIESELRQAGEAFACQRKAFTDLKITTEAIEETLKEIRIEHESLADAITAALVTAEERRKAIVLALTEDQDLAPNCPDTQFVSGKVDTLLEHISVRLETLRTRSNDKARKEMTAEIQELRARKLIAQHELAILEEIDRKKRYAAYNLCIDDTKTQAITRKSTAVTRIAVTQKLKDTLRNELMNLAFRHVEVKLKEVGGAEGVLYHKLVLRCAPNIELPKVVSEGEQRCLSIAAFFAELSTADAPSCIVFDDPISSLDFRWREGVASRLVEEAKTRQVIVFTHDVVFLLLLKQLAHKQSVAQLDQHVRRLSNGAGVCEEELPWVALPVREKIGFLKNEWQAADKLFRENRQPAYEKDATHLYGLLREAWERALEEILLAGIVERFRSSVKTQHIDTLADISSDDCSTVDAAMTKCSKWLPGHDQAAAARAPVPEPSVLKADIEALGEWVSRIRRRRCKKGKEVTS